MINKYHKLMEKMETFDDNNEVKMILIEYYKAMIDETEEVEYFQKYFEQISQLKVDSDIVDWYRLGYRKYQIGEFDRALMAFGFGAYNNHLESILAGAYIWDQNLPKELTGKLGNHKIGASYYYMQAFTRGHIESAINLANMLKSNVLIEEGIIDFKDIQLAYSIYDLLSAHSSEAKFNKACMIYKGEGTIKNPLLSISILNEMISSSLKDQKLEKNILPLYLTKFYYLAQEAYFDIIG